MQANRRPVCKYIGELRVQNGFLASLAPTPPQHFGLRSGLRYSQKLINNQQILLHTTDSNNIIWTNRTSVKEYDFPGDQFPTYGTLYDLVGTQLTCPMATQEHTVLSSVHAHLTLGLGREGGRGEGEGNGEREREGGEKQKKLWL